MSTDIRSRLVLRINVRTTRTYRLQSRQLDRTDTFIFPRKLMKSIILSRDDNHDGKDNACDPHGDIVMTINSTLFPYNFSQSRYHAGILKLRYTTLTLTHLPR